MLTAHTGAIPVGEGVRNIDSPSRKNEFPSTKIDSPHQPGGARENMISPEETMIFPEQKFISLINLEAEARNCFGKGLVVARSQLTSQNVFINQFQKVNSPTKSSTYSLPLRCR